MAKFFKHPAVQEKMNAQPVAAAQADEERQNLIA